MGVLSWLIEDGAVDGTELSGLPVALACATATTSRVAVDVGAVPGCGRVGDQRAGLEGIFTGRLGGDAERHFSWAWKASELVAVRAVEIRGDHTRRRQRLRIRDRVSVRIRRSV